jgi:hypothetical protein
MAVGGPVAEMYLKNLEGEPDWRLRSARIAYPMDFAPWRRYWTVFRTGDTPMRVQPLCAVSCHGMQDGRLGDHLADGTAWFDDLFLYEAPSNVTNMVINGGFEGPEVARGWPLGWTTDWGDPTPGQIDRADANGIWGLDESTAAEGRRSLRIVSPGFASPPPKSGGYPQAYHEPPVGTRLAKDKPYVLSAYLKADRPNLAVQILAGGYGKGLGSEITVSDQWKRYSFTVRPDSDQWRPFIKFMIYKRGTLWIDAVQFEPGTEPTKYNEWRDPVGPTKP